MEHFPAAHVGLSEVTPCCQVHVGRQAEAGLQIALHVLNGGQLAMENITMKVDPATLTLISFAVSGSSLCTLGLVKAPKHGQPCRGIDHSIRILIG